MEGFCESDKLTSGISRNLELRSLLVFFQSFGITVDSEGPVVFVAVVVVAGVGVVAFDVVIIDIAAVVVATDVN